MLRYVGEIVPEESDKVNCAPGVLLLIATKFPKVPDSPKLDTVCVVPAVKVTVAGCVVLVMLLKVLEPLMVNAPVPP